MNGYLRPFWFILIVILLALLLRYHPQSAAAQPLSQSQSTWPADYSFDPGCVKTTVHNTIPLGKNYKIGSTLWYLENPPENDGHTELFSLGGTARGTLIYHWKTADPPYQTHTEKVDWVTYRSATCTDCANTIHGTPSPFWSAYTYTNDGRTRTHTKLIPLFDADMPTYACGNLPIVESDTAKQYCLDEKSGKTDWFYLLEVIPGYAKPGDCSEAMAPTAVPTPKVEIQYVYLKPPASAPPTFMDWVNTWWPSWLK